MVVSLPSDDAPDSLCSMDGATLEAESRDMLLAAISLPEVQMPGGLADVNLDESRSESSKSAEHSIGGLAPGSLGSEPSHEADESDDNMGSDLPQSGGAKGGTM